MKLQNWIKKGRKWFSFTPERALDAAYRAAVKIKTIEEDHFQGQKVSSLDMGYSASVLKVFQNDVENHLKTIQLRLTEFKISRSLLILSDDNSTQKNSIVNQQDVIGNHQRLSTIKKLDYIDAIVNGYRQIKEENSSALIAENFIKQDANPKNNPNKSKKSNSSLNTETISNKTGILPRSFMRTINRIRQEIDPQADDTEEEVINKFRRSRNKTVISIYFVLLLIIVPLFTHQVSKTFLIAPLVEKYFSNHEQVIFLNQDLEEEALNELHQYEENLHFKNLIGLAPSISNQEMEEKVHDRAETIAEEYRHRGVNGVSNVFADFCSLVAFAAIIFFCKKEIAIIKSFIDEIVYGLSDSAKAFLLILLTDIFVGYHSPHGWEVILEGISRHLGLPENHDFNFLFIATFPVILDTVLKYWIFRYLNRISPSSVATYKNMNE